MSGQRVLCNVILLGDNNVGKSVLMRRYIDQAYPKEPHYCTIGVDRDEKSMTVGGCNVRLAIWGSPELSRKGSPLSIGLQHQDSPGHERFDSVTYSHCRWTNAAIVCYAVAGYTSSISFEKMKSWVEHLQYCEEHCRIYICGTKTDLIENDKNRRQVDFHEVQDYADGIKAHLCEVSSKTGHGVDELFQKVVEDFVNDRNVQVQTEPKGVDLTQKKDIASHARCYL